MGTSLGFHIVFAVLGVRLPLLLVVAEGLWLRTKDPVWLALARRWSRAFGILFAVGAVSATVLSFELGLLWPRFRRSFRDPRRRHCGSVVALADRLCGAGRGRLRRRRVGPPSHLALAFYVPFTIAMAVRIRNGSLVSGFAAGWTSPCAILIGAFALSICTYLAATYLTVETEGTPLEADFRWRALVAGVVAGALSLLALALAPAAAPPLAHALFGRGLPLVALAFVNGPIALWAVWRSRPRIARIAVVAQIVFVLWAWAIGQWPYLVPPDLTIDGSAAPQSTLVAWLVVVVMGAIFLVPSLLLLFRLFKARNPAAIV